MITFPRTYDEAVASVGEKRAGGIDVQGRYRSSITSGPLVDLCTHIGSLVRLATLLNDQRLQQSYPGLVQAAAHIATPQIRAIGTVGGNLFQHTYCWYYRHPNIRCYKKGEENCPARNGNHLYGVCFDTGPCVAPYPSTLSIALLAYDASLQFHGKPQQPLLDFFRDEVNQPTSGCSASSQLLTKVILPSPRERERAAYLRVTSRAFADWPLVEAMARLDIEGPIQFARVVVGGVAPVPLRLHHVEAVLVGKPALVEVFEEAANTAIDRANPLPLTRYKVSLLRECVLQILLMLRQQCLDNLTS